MAAALAAAREPTEAREALERRWRDRLTFEPRLATLVTAEGGRREPFHRWIPYKQGFSPGLVRQFLCENPRTPNEWASHPVLDPFSGSGTCVVECARYGVGAIGVEAIAALVFLTRAKFEREFPPLPPGARLESRTKASMWQEIADCIELPVHRAALMLAVGRQHTTAGRVNRGARPLGVVLAEVAAMMRDELFHPLPQINRVEVGDARRITSIDDGAIGGILTSPLYLSRHDYAQITNPYQTVYGYWYGGQECVEQISGGITAKPQLSTLTPTLSLKGRGGNQALTPTLSLGGRGSGGTPSRTVAAAEEASEWLARIGLAKPASLVRGYIEDVTLVLHECYRVLAAGGACWMVVGGARIKDVYVPSDLMVAEIAEGCGFHVGAIRVARDLVGAARKFGRAGHVTPRESLLVMRRAC